MILAIDIGNTNIVVGCIDEAVVHLSHKLNVNQLFRTP